MTIYWPVSEDIKLDETHYVIHFDALDRNYDDMEAELSANTPEKILASPVTIEGKHYVKFETGSFSPFVLVYEKTDPVITEYSLTVENGTGDGRYEAGEQVTITADAAPAGKVFDKWVLTEGGGTLENAEASTTVFTMSAGDAIVTARYRDGDEEPIQHIITATAGEGGSISPAGTVPVLAGGRQTFEILSDEGFVIDKLLIDGVEITDATGKADFNYSFTSVTKNHTITVAFHQEGGTVESENPSIPSGSVSTPDEGGSSSSLEDYGVSSSPDPMPQTGETQNLNLWLILLLLSIIGMTITVAGSSKRRHARGRHMR